MTRCWEIWCGDVFLGYEYTYDAAHAMAKAVGMGGVASQYRVAITDLVARLA
jgi:hypothetical protein